MLYHVCYTSVAVLCCKSQDEGPPRVPVMQIDPRQYSLAAALTPLIDVGSLNMCSYNIYLVLLNHRLYGFF